MTSTAQRDPGDPRLVHGASGLLREFNEAGVLTSADVHVARRLGRLAHETDDSVLLAVALAVRAPRLGHVLVDLERIRDTAAVDGDEAVDLDALGWPAAPEWIASVAGSGLVAVDEDDGCDRPLRLNGSWLYLDRYWAEEVSVARALRELAQAPPEPVDGDLLGRGLGRLFGVGDNENDGEREGADAVDDGPRRAAMTAACRRLAVIAGGPGTGKTTTVARVVALLCEQALAGGGTLPLIALAAPTGKAAARLEEAVHAQAAALDVEEAVRSHLLGLPALTIHRLLGWRPGSASRFRHDRTQRLPHDLVIVDETSMVSLSLMARLIEALRSSARLILVGDPGQLASIEAGAVLGDIVAAGETDGAGEAAGAGETAGAGDAAGVGSGDAAAAALRAGTVVLRRVHRFGGAIAGLAEAIRAGDATATLDRLRAGSDEVVWLEADVAGGEMPEAVIAPALEAARAMADAARRGDAAAALAALGRWRILCAHRRGPAGVSGWTSRLESRLAAEFSDLDPEDRWYVGRPLLVSENDYELRLNNGDIGVVIRRDDDRVIAAFERSGTPWEYSPNRLGAIDTVYAMTIHKSQGSQFDTAAVLLPGPDSRLLTRELLYTAATRAQRRLILAGTEESVRAAVERPVARASGLARRLRGDLGGRPM